MTTTAEYTPPPAATAIEDALPSIFRAMGAVMNDVTGVGKHGRNTQQNFAFRGIDDVLNAVGPALRTHGVFLAPCVGDYSAEDVEVGAKKTPMKSVTLTVSYTFYGPAGDSVTVTVPGEAMDSGDKAVSKAMSVALRTALIQTFALPTNEKDPDTDVYERAPREPAPQRPPQNPQNGNGQRPPQNPQNGQGARSTSPNDGPPPETPEQKLTRVVGRLLFSADQQQVDWWIGKITEYEFGPRDVSRLVSPDVRAALGIGEETLTADDLVRHVTTYAKKHHSGPAHVPEPPQEASGTPS